MVAVGDSANGIATPTVVLLPFLRVSVVSARWSCWFRIPALLALVACRPGALWAEQNPPDAPLPVITVQGERAQLHASGVVIRVPVDPLQASDLPGLLAALPGVQVRSAGGLGSYSEASLRGSNGRQVRLLLDGLPLDSGGGEATSLSLYSPLLLEEVDIYKGRVPVHLGSGLAGTIDLRSRAQLAAPVTGTLSLGSFGEQQVHAAAQLSAPLQLAAGTLSADNDFRFINQFGAFDPANPERRTRESRQHAATAQTYAQLRYTGGLQLSAHLLDNAQELPTRANSADARGQLDTRSYALTLASPEQADWQAALSHRITREQFRDPASQLGLSVQDSRDDTQRTFLRLGRDFSLLRGALHAEHLEYRSDDRLGALASSSARRTSFGSGVEIEAGERLRYNASLQLGWTDERAGDAGDSQWLIEPALGATRAFGACLAAVNLGQRERLPTFFERYGDRGLFRGNPRLQSESATYADLGARCTPGRAAISRLELTLFGQDLRDAISPAFSAQGVGRSVNSPRAQIYGLEFGSGGRWIGLDWQLGATWQHSEDLGDTRATRGRQLPGRFEKQLNARIARPLARVHLFYAFRYESGQFYDSVNLLEATPLRRHDIGLSGAAGAVGWSLQWLNLGDDNFEQFNGFPTPGRRLLLALSYPKS